LYVWNKKGGKFKNLFQILKSVRKEKYDYLINLQRFATTGLFTLFSGAKYKAGFKKNPFSFAFSYRVNHYVQHGKHEVERNQLLISQITDSYFSKPRLYPPAQLFENVAKLKEDRYICISPASVWFTKQFPPEKWIEFIGQLKKDIRVYLLGAPNDIDLCDEIIRETKKDNIVNLAGKLNLLESAALMKDAEMNYSNDSAPLHLASAMDAPATAIFCSTIPGFGFGPLSSNSTVIETHENLDCRPCGLHGKNACPKGHFKCAYQINVSELLSILKT
jgi:heptosyltransferase-2